MEVLQHGLLQVPDQGRVRPGGDTAQLWGGTHLGLSGTALSISCNLGSPAAGVPEADAGDAGEEDDGHGATEQHTVQRRLYFYNIRKSESNTVGRDG